jgi:cytochrome c biogenesis protein CcmG, thiol:disulfide interchange protein DsbE
MSVTSPEEHRARPRPKIALFLPLLFLVLLLVLLFAALRTGDPSRLPSPLIGKAVPDFALPVVPNLIGDYGPVPGLTSAGLKTGRVSVLNVWASWCGPCVAELPELIALGKQGVPVFSINYKDKPEAARRFLATYGNPYRAIGVDEAGFTAIDFGVYGVPETFVIDGHGRIAYRFPGPLTPEIVERQILPAIRSAADASQSQR